MARTGIPAAWSVAIGLLVLATPLAAQETIAPPAPDSDTVILQLREQLVGAQQEIAALRAQVNDKTDLETALRAARDKNDRLVAIANELIAAYGKRYRRGRFLPFETGRRKFEAELQDIGDRVHDNRWNAGSRPAPADIPAPTDQPRPPEGQ